MALPKIPLSGSAALCLRKLGNHHNKTLFLLSLVVFLPGCLGFENLAKVEPVTKVPSELALDLDNYEFPGVTGVAFLSAQTNLRARNQLQGAILRRSEIACENHKADIHTNSAVFNVTLGVLTSALGGAGAIVTGQTAANILAGAASFANAAKSQVNEEVYQNMLAAAIIAEIDENRVVANEKIISKRNQNITLYTVEDAIRDAEQYNHLCSFYQGVASLIKKAGVTRRTKEELVDASIAKLRVELAKDKTNLADLETNIASARADGDASLQSNLEQQRTILLGKIGGILSRLQVMDKFL